MDLNEARQVLKNAGYTILKETAVEDNGKQRRAFSPKTTTIGSQVWMAENLDIDDGGEGIRHNDGHTYYTWEAAMRIASTLEGWHLPTKAEFEKLLRYCGGWKSAGPRLKSRQGWADGGNGSDFYRFTAIPAGQYPAPRWMEKGTVTYFWSSSENGKNYSFAMELVAHEDSVFIAGDRNDDGLSVRLLKGDSPVKRRKTNGTPVIYKYAFWSSLSRSDDLWNYVEGVEARLNEWGKDNGFTITVSTDSDQDDAYVIKLIIKGLGDGDNEHLTEFFAKEKSNAPSWVDYSIGGLRMTRV